MHVPTAAYLALHDQSVVNPDLHQSARQGCYPNFRPENGTAAETSTRQAPLTSPNSFSITAIFLPWLAVRIWLTRVVFPAPVDERATSRLRATNSRCVAVRPTGHQSLLTKKACDNSDRDFVFCSCHRDQCGANLQGQPAYSGKFRERYGSMHPASECTGALVCACTQDTTCAGRGQDGGSPARKMGPRFVSPGGPSVST